MSESISEWTDGNRAELKISLGANSIPDDVGYIAYCFGNGMEAESAINGAYCFIIDVAASDDDADIFSKNGDNAPVITYTSTDSFEEGILGDVVMIEDEYDVIYSSEIASGEDELWEDGYEFSVSF